MVDQLDGISPRRKAFDRVMVNSIEAGVRFFVAHWLLLANALAFVYFAIPMMAPVFMAAHFDWLGDAIYFVYRSACHQLPYRSYFLFGQQLTYSKAELGPYMNPLRPSDLIGNAILGYKVAFCERDLAIYASIFGGGLIFAVVRRHLQPLSWYLYPVLLIPIAVDGFSQLFLPRESTWFLRTVTGAIFGLATVWLIYPRFEKEFRKAQAMYAIPKPFPEGPPERGGVEALGESR